MKLPLTGGCQCGALRYEIGEAPHSTYTCHCTECQRTTGSAFSLAIVVPERAFRVTKGAPRLVERTADSGRIVTRWLCPECGCWIAGGPQPPAPGDIAAGAAPGEMIRRVRAGTLDDRSWLRPTAHFWTRSKQPWVVLPEGDRIYETQPF
jgi:hypothetical protein